MKKLGLFLCRLFLDQEGQATTEYTLLLAVIVGLFLLLRSILAPHLANLMAHVDAQIMARLGSNLHYFNVGH